MPAQKMFKFVLGTVIVATPILLTTNSFAAIRERIVFRTINSDISYTFARTVRLTPRPIQSATPRTTVRPTVSPTTTTAPSTAPSNTNTAIYPQQILDLVNNARQQQGLNSLTLQDNLNTSAQKYSLDMATGNFFSHTAPSGETMTQRITRAGYMPYSWIGENIAAGQKTPQEVFTGWMNSTGHRANILKPQAQHLGVGYSYKSTSTYKHYWVQHFGAR